MLVITNLISSTVCDRERTVGYVLTEQTSAGNYKFNIIYSL